MKIIGLKTNVGDRHATWLELFYDLIYVIVIAKLTHMIGYAHDGHLDLSYFAKATVLFLPVWWCWIGHTMFANRFDQDDTTHRLLTLLQMFGAVMMAVFIERAFGEGALGFVLSYVGIRVVLVIMYLRVHAASKELRPITRLFATGFSLGILCWIASLFVDAPFSYAFWGIGLLIDFATPWVGQKRLANVSVHKEHLPERLGLLTIIILGESVLGIVTGIANIAWNSLNLLNLVSAFALLSSVWWLYFETLEHSLAGKMLRSGQLSIYGHLPLYIGLIMLSAGLLHHITADIPAPESLRLLAGGLMLTLVPLHIMQAKQSSTNIQTSLIGIITLYVAIGGILLSQQYTPAYAPLVLLTLSVTLFIAWEHKTSRI